MARALELALAGERLELMPERAVFLPDHATLLVADAHIGKAVSFRRLGMPVPRGTTTETLATLSAAVDATGAERLIFLGDFLHSARARADAALDALTRWRERHAGLRLTLVRGNHDLHAGDPPKALGIDAVGEPLRLGALALCHHPPTVEGAYVLAGHAHPCVVLGGRAQDRLRLPCFWFTDAARQAVGVLPAFGSFTGMHLIDRRPEDRVFAVMPQRVIELP